MSFTEMVIYGIRLQTSKDQNIPCWNSPKSSSACCDVYGHWTVINDDATDIHPLICKLKQKGSMERAEVAQQAQQAVAAAAAAAVSAEWKVMKDAWIQRLASKLWLFGWRASRSSRSDFYIPSPVAKSSQLKIQSHLMKLMTNSGSDSSSSFICFFSTEQHTHSSPFA